MKFDISKLVKTVLLAVLMGTVSVYTVHAQIRVTKSAGTKSTIDFSGFKASGNSDAHLLLNVLRQDLISSGWFMMAGRGSGEFRILGSSSVKGKTLRVECQVYRTGNQRALLSQSYSENVQQTRSVAHHVADDIVFAITGRKGIATSRIAMVGTSSGHKELYVCDADGGNLVQLTRDRTVSIAPKWGPQGKQLVYTSFLKRFPDVYLIDIATGARNQIAGYPGLNTGANISPNGKDVALILSKDGNPELYIKNLRNGKLSRISRTGRAVEASPSWSPDGRRLVYVSDQSGRPHLYIVSRSGGRAQRITLSGRENVAPDWGENGMIAYCSRIGGSYQIFVMDPKTRQPKQVSSGPGDFEDPSWAPDGRHIVCSRSQNYRSSVIILDTMGDSPIALTNYKGEWYSPTWAPK